MTIAQHAGKGKANGLAAAASDLLGHFKSGLLSKQERDDLWRIMTGSRRADAVAHDIIARMTQKLEGRGGLA